MASGLVVNRVILHHSSKEDFIKVGFPEYLVSKYFISDSWNHPSSSPGLLFICTLMPNVIPHTDMNGHTDESLMKDIVWTTFWCLLGGNWKMPLICLKIEEICYSSVLTTQRNIQRKHFLPGTHLQWVSIFVLPWTIFHQGGAGEAKGISISHLNSFQLACFTWNISAAKLLT